MAGGKVLTNIQHGETVPEPPPPPAAAVAAAAAAGADGAELLNLAPVDEVTFETPFDYLLSALTTDPAAHLPADDPAATVAALKALGDAMVEEDPEQPAGDSTIPTVYTYWGQFIDHDLTANTDRDTPELSDITKADLVPLAPDFIVANLKNLRQPTANLDSVYGDGPTFDPAHPTEAGTFYDGIKLKVGRVASKEDNPGILGDLIPPDGDLDRDLPRDTKLAQIADARNDENLIVAQLHISFLRFHNAVVDWVKANEPSYCGNEEQQFERARQLTRWHHQWLVVHDYLKTVTLAGIPDKILLGGLKHYKPTGEPFMPLEFSVAAYRFGHTMVRGIYDYNRNFGRGNGVLPNAPFTLLFTFTGKGFPTPFFGQTDVLPFNWIIEWDRFVDKGSSLSDHFARKVDTLLAPPLKNLDKEGNNPPTPEIGLILKRLARRNLLRGYLLSIPTGQSVAQAMGVTPLSAAELTQGSSAALQQALTDGGFLERTPLWFYLLKEAEVRANGNSLGELGSRIVCETIIGQLRHDPESFLNHPGGWDPSQGVKLPNGDPIVTIADFLRFAGTLS